MASKEGTCVYTKRDNDNEETKKYTFQENTAGRQSKKNQYMAVCAGNLYVISFIKHYLMLCFKLYNLNC